MACTSRSRSASATGGRWTSLPGGKQAEQLLKINTRNLGWHGNALLVKQHVDVMDVAALDLPTLEPRGAVMAELLIGDRAIRVIGMHLDLSGLWRRRQMRAILEAIHRRPHKMPTILMGDTNEWRDAGGCLKELNGSYRVAPTGPSFHSRRPVAALDRIIVDQSLAIEAAGVHASAEARKASDHLPIWAGWRFTSALTSLDRAFEAARVASPRELVKSGLARRALDRRADPHRLAIFDDRAAGDVHAALLEHRRDRIVAQHLGLGVDHVLIAALTASAAAPSPPSLATPEPKKYLSSNMPRSQARYLFDVTRLTVDSCISIASATLARVSGRSADTPCSKKPCCCLTISLATLTIVRARWSSAFTSQLASARHSLSQAFDALSCGPRFQFGMVAAIDQHASAAPHC